MANSNFVYKLVCALFLFDKARAAQEQSAICYRLARKAYQSFNYEGALLFQLRAYVLSATSFDLYAAAQDRRREAYSAESKNDRVEH